MGAWASWSLLPKKASSRAGRAVAGRPGVAGRRTPA